jgi:hypothetical protein
MRSSMIRDLLAQRGATPRALWKKMMGLLFSSSFLILMASFCNSGTVLTIAQAPANTLSVIITIQHQYTTTTSAIIIAARFLQGKTEGPLDSKLGFACNGVELMRMDRYLASNMSVPRQPAGGAYDCVYTDEKGNKTSLTIPIPPGTLAITSPAAGATIHPAAVPVPTPGVTPTPTPPPPPPPPRDTPTPTPIGSPTPTSPPPIPTPTIPGTTPLTRGIMVRYIMPTLPANASAQVWVTALYTGAGSQSEGGIVGPAAPATGAYLLTDTNSLSGVGFETFPPGSSGKIQLNSTFSWSLPPGGFQSIRIQYDDMLSIPVTWN